MGCKNLTQSISQRRWSWHYLSACVEVNWRYSTVRWSGHIVYCRGVQSVDGSRLHFDWCAADSTAQWCTWRDVLFVSYLAQKLVSLINCSVCCWYFNIAYHDGYTVWRIRGKIIRTVLCCIQYDSCAQWYAHIYEQFRFAPCQRLWINGNNLLSNVHFFEVWSCYYQTN